MLRLAWIALLAVLGACRSQSIAYEPNLDLDPAAALRVVQRGFEEQPKHLRALSIEVTSEFVRSTYSKVGKSWVVRRVRDEYVETIYFDALSELGLYRKGSEWRVKLVNEARTVSRVLVFYDEERAQSFLDAMASLREERRRLGSP